MISYKTLIQCAISLECCLHQKFTNKMTCQPVWEMMKTSDTWSTGNIVRWGCHWKCGSFTYCASFFQQWFFKQNIGARDYVLTVTNVDYDSLWERVKLFKFLKILYPNPKTQIFCCIQEELFNSLLTRRKFSLFIPDIRLTGNSWHDEDNDSFNSGNIKVLTSNQLANRPFNESAASRVHLKNQNAIIN